MVLFDLDWPKKIASPAMLGTALQRVERIDCAFEGQSIPTRPAEWI